MTEQILGRWLAQGGGRREKIVLATKVYGRMGGGPNDSRLSAAHIRRACEESLRRLATDHIDLYQMHHVDRDTPWDEIWQAMEQLVAQGKVLYVGSSNFAAWHIVDANAAAARRDFLGLVSEQSLYNLTARTIELEVIPACRAHGVAICPWSPLGGGLLGGALQEDSRGPALGRSASRSGSRRSAPQLERWEALLRRARRRAGGRRDRLDARQSGDHRADHRPAHGRAARGRLRGLEVKLTKEALASSTRSGPARAARRRKRTRGDGPVSQPGTIGEIP